MTELINDTSWTVQDAKKKLSEILRKARKDGPQMIGRQAPCVVVSKEEWDNRTGANESLAAWLIQNSPGIDIELPVRGEGNARQIPFVD